MRFISTKIHGILDYVMGFALVMPWILRYEGVAAVTASLLGVTLLVYSFMTDYELGGIKVISMPAHLVIDALSGIFLAASPWIFAFEDNWKIPFLAAGIFEIVVVLFSQTAAPARMNQADAQKAREWKGAVTR